MRILALDLSTKTGWAITEDGRAAHYGQISYNIKDFSLPYPMNLIQLSVQIGNQVKQVLVEKGYVDAIVIEQTNQSGLGRNRDAQKVLEFIHYSVAVVLFSLGRTPIYMDTSQWHKHSGMKMSKDQRAANKEIKLERMRLKNEITAKAISEVTYNYQMRHGSRAFKGELEKARKNEIKSLITKRMRSIRGENVKGKITNKHLSVKKVKELFGIDLLQNQNDIADAILIGYGYYKSKEMNQ